jgi:hypothetical protein
MKLSSFFFFGKPIADQLLKKFSAFYGARRFITVFTRAFTLSCARLIPSTYSYFFKIRFNSIILSTPWYFKLSLLFRSSHQNPVCISHLSYACYKSRPSHSPLFGHSNNICRIVQGTSLHWSTLAVYSFFLLNINIVCRLNNASLLVILCDYMFRQACAIFRPSYLFA